MEITRPFSFKQVVVEKGWQGVTYVMLDRLEACGVSYASAVEVRYESFVDMCLGLISKSLDSVINY